MAISANYITLQRQIADELGNRTDLLSPLGDSGLTDSPIKLAIRTAIAKWESEPFWFNEVLVSPFLTTVSGQEYYTPSDAASISTSPQITTLKILYSGIWMPLTERSFDYLEEISTNPTGRGIPNDWAFYGTSIRLYPIPDNAYPITSVQYTRVADLAGDTDANIWTTYGYDLIRSEAKLTLARETLHDGDLAAECETAIYGGPTTHGYLTRLKSETARRVHTRFRPSRF